jgi:hypothetical protein
MFRTVHGMRLLLGAGNTTDFLLGMLKVDRNTKVPGVFCKLPSDSLGSWYVLFAQQSR